MASDLATALLQGNAPGLAADPATAQVIPNLTLAQAMMNEGMSGAPAYPMQAIGRLAQVLAGVKLMSDTQGQLSDLYGRGVEAASRGLPADHPLQKFLQSPDPFARMAGMRNLDKALIQLGDVHSLPPGNVLTYGPGATNTGETAAQAAGRKAAAEAPYQSGGEGTRETPRGRETYPMTAATRAAIQPDFGPVNPSRVQGQPQNLTGSIIPPGGTRAQQPAVPALPPRPRIPSSEPAAAGFEDRFNAAFPGGQPVQNPEFKAREEQYGAAGKALGGVIAEHIEAGGKTARESLNALDTIESAMRTNEGKGIVTGPHAESILKFREALDGMGIDTSWIKTGMPQSELIQKMNAQLARASAKAMTGRPTQFEFQAWQKNSPGLMNSREGSLALIDVLRQQAHQDVELGKLAQNKKNWDSWPEVVDRFYADPSHALVNPFTGRSMREEINAARSGGARPAAPGAGAMMPVVAPGARSAPPPGAPSNARLAPDGHWYVVDPGRPGKYLRVQ